MSKVVSSCLLLALCYGLAWSQTNLVMIWDVAIMHKQIAYDNSSMIFDVDVHSKLKLIVGSAHLVAESKLPVQVKPPTEENPSKIAWSKYYAVFNREMSLIAWGGVAAAMELLSEGNEIPINEGIIWKPSKNLLTVGSPTGVQDPVWMPSLILLCYLSHKDIQFVEKLTGAKFTPSTKGGTRIYTHESGDGETVVRLFYSDDLPEKMEIYSMGKTVQVVSEGRFSVEPTKTPYKVRYTRAEGNLSEEVVFTLKQVQMANSDNNEPTLPLGVTIYDYRLSGKDLTLTQMRESEDRAIQYRWKGRLISEDELRQLAYQEGNLLPPETPQRRYSFWMFLPAIVLFGLALLFYLKRRR